MNDTHHTHDQQNAHAAAGSIHLPRPTAWPMVLALGITLAIAGLVTNFSVTLLGLLIITMASVGWFRCVLPHEEHDLVATHDDGSTELPGELPATVADEDEEENSHAGQLSLSLGIFAGLIGGVAMAAPAMLFGVIKFGSPWYAINLMAGGMFADWNDASDQFLSQFHFEALLTAAIIHVLVSALVGIFYAVIIPLFPRRHWLTSGILAPALWSFLVFSLLGSVSPVLAARIDPVWFILSQVAFGLVTGTVINLRMNVTSAAYMALPFAARAGLHTSGKESNNNDKNEEKG